ncbi:MAG: YceD family protein [Lactobacillus sp.]|nr:YceD family protein [Lactobacillus sp.]
MLAINFNRIRNSDQALTEISEPVELRPEFFERSKKILTDAKNVKVTGSLFYDDPFVIGSFKVTADLVVPSTRSLKPVEFHQEFKFTENYYQTSYDPEMVGDDEVLVKIDGDLIDLQTAVEDNIILNIPERILAPDEEDEFPEGKGWKVISEADFDKQEKASKESPFAALKDLFDDQE